MPEVITKYPDVLVQVLESAGARCGAGLPQEILKTCPRERFCKLPGGEVCVYGVAEVPAMTQLSRAELCPGRTEAGPPGGGAAGALAGWGAAAVLPALAVALVLRRRR